MTLVPGRVVLARGHVEELTAAESDLDQPAKHRRQSEHLD